MEAKTKKSSTTSETITPGIYRLTADMPAIHPDKRIRHDWRSAPMQAGMLLAVRDEGPRVHYDPDKPVPVLLVLTELHGWAHQRVYLSDAPGALLACLERVEDCSVSDYLAFIERGSRAARILDHLMTKGLLTTRGIDELLKEIDEIDRGQS